MGTRPDRVQIRPRALASPRIEPMKWGGAGPTDFMTFRHLRILGWIGLFLLVVEVPLEYRAYKRGWDSLLFGRQAPERPADADETVRYGPTLDFPFRSAITPKQKAPGSARIWIASASYALGENLPVDHVFPTLLQEGLAERGLSTDVLNAGEVGTAIPENTAQLRAEAVAWKPDIVVLYQMSTDIDDLTKRVLVGDPKGDASAPILNPRLWLEHTTTYPILKSQLSSRLTRMRVLARTLEPEGSKRFEKRVRDFLVAAREIGAVPVLCTFAASVDRDADEDMPLHVYRFNIRLGRAGWHDSLDRWNDIIRRVGKEEGVVVADVNAVLHGQGAKFVDFVHFNKEGHEDVARVLIEAMAPVVEGLPR